MKNKTNEEIKKLQKIAGILKEVKYQDESNEDTKLFNTLEGLANNKFPAGTHNLKTLKTMLETLTTDWMAEGFEKSDIKKFISKLITEV
jgi:hypothetical protein